MHITPLTILYSKGAQLQLLVVMTWVHSLLKEIKGRRLFPECMFRKRFPSQLYIQILNGLIILDLSTCLSGFIVYAMVQYNSPTFISTLLFPGLNNITVFLEMAKGCSTMLVTQKGFFNVM